MRTISHIVFDLETIPGKTKPGPDDIKVPGNIKKEESIRDYRNNPLNLNAAYKAQSLSYIDGRIHSIGFKIGTEPVGVVFDPEDEEKTVKAFEAEVSRVFHEHYGADTLYGTTWVGHNLKTFDLPYLWLRARKYKCELLLKVLGEQPDDIKFQDTMMVACVTDKYKGYVSLDNACKMFGLPGKGDFNGSMVYGAWKAGENQKIADYCIEDVQKTYDLAVALGIIIPE